MTTGPFKIAVDFDGTIVDHRYPDIGEEAPGALEYLKKWSRDPRVCLMLWTNRSNSGTDGMALFRACQWCMERDVVFQYVNRAPQAWTTSPKLYAHTYIDDLGAAVPLIFPATFRRPCVDWSVVGPWVDAKIVAHADCRSPAIV